MAERPVHKLRPRGNAVVPHTWCGADPARKGNRVAGIRPGVGPPTCRECLKQEAREKSRGRKLWVIEDFISCEPHLYVWPLLEETKDSYIVGIRSGQRIFKKGTVIGRHYFLQEADAVTYLRKAYEAARDNAMRKATRMSILLTADDATVVAYARGVDDVCLAVELKMKRKEGEAP